MGWFKRKSDPISEKAREIQREIERLESEIRTLSSQPLPAPPAQTPPSREHPHPAPAKSTTDDASGEPPPRLRSTAYPQGRTVPLSASGSPPASPGSSHEPILEEGARNPFRSSPSRVAVDDRELGVSRSDFVSIWRRFRNHWRGPATSNPKLVNYLAAGSIQGLRPLRYEKRVARNRFILLLVCLILVLWGIIATVLKH